MNAATVSPQHVRALRAFNRFYTQRIGVLSPYLGSELSLTEVRVLYELSQREHLTATELSRELALDAGYLSRILRRFEAQGWLARAPSPADARQSLLNLTPQGHAVYAPLDKKSREQVAELLAPLSDAGQQQLVQVLSTAQRLLAPQAATAAPATRTLVLRDPRPGDMGWVVQQHGELYAAEYDYSNEFEALVAGIAAQFIQNFNPAHEKAWIAELDGQRVGAVLVVRKSARVARLRLLILRPEARGLGLGGRLVDECIAFARAKGYRKLTLWTNGQLHAARAIYQSRGFVLTDSETMDGYGQRGLVSETWELTL
jgi:DNA-binding MarR family transcriptional regulator/GNAT superfamily N-acetyltransferase